jgi:hypothetical protein
MRLNVGDWAEDIEILGDQVGLLRKSYEYLFLVMMLRLLAASIGISLASLEGPRWLMVSTAVSAARACKDIADLDPLASLSSSTASPESSPERATITVLVSL